MAYKAYYIPSGPNNLATFFPGIDFSQIDRYYIEVKANDEIIATTPKFSLDGENCGTDKVRLRWLNYEGGIDGMNFKKIDVEHEAKSSTYQKPTQSPLIDKTIHSFNRFNVKSNDTITLRNHEYAEEELGWLDELIDSPWVLMEVSAYQSQPAGYIPVVIQDLKFQKFKEEERYYYEINLVIQLSHEKFIIRN